MISNALKLSTLGYRVLRPRYISSRIFCVTNYQQKRGTHGTNTQTNYIIPLSFHGKQNTLIPRKPLLFTFFISKPVPRYYISNLQQIKYYSTKGKDPVCKPKKKSKAPLYFFAAFLALSGVIGYAKYDPDFRSWLETQVPGSDEVIAFIFQEKVSFLERISNMLDAIKDKIVDVINSAFGSEPDKASGGGSKKKLPPCDDENKPYKPPRSAFKPLLENEPKKKEVKYTETRELKGKPTSDKVTITQITKEEEPQPQPEKSDLPLDEVADTQPSTLVELEESIGNHAQVAIKSYNDAICVLRDHAEDIYKLVEQSVEKVDPKIWSQIKDKTEIKEKLVSEAETNAKAAEQSIDQLKKSIDSPKLVAPQEMKDRAKNNMQKVLSDVQVAKKSFEKEKAKVSVTENYWSKVEEARKHFSEELEILFPNVRLSDKQLKLAEGEIDLFILYAFQNILFYQKELSKLETVGEARIKRALDQAKVGDPDVVKTTIEAEIDKEKRKLQEDFQKRTLELKAEFEKDIRSQLKRQAEAHNDHLQEAMALKEKEVERKLSRRVEERVLQERTRFKEELSGMIARLKGLDEAIKKRAEQDKYAQQSQNLWSACQSLVAAINDSDVNKPYADQLKPLQGEIDAIAKAGEKDDLVDTIVKSIPPEAKERGVYSEDALRERFLNVERVASIVAIVPEEGASLPLIFLSYLQSKIMIKNPLPVPAYELANEPFDPSSLSTFDVLQRARFWMDRGDLAQALKYMNLLQGGPRAVANDWIKEATIMLETQQAANVLFVHASASGLVYA